VLLSPVLLAVLVAMAPSRGPLLYREPRVSRGRVFPLLKFRTLRREVGAEGHARLLEADPANLTWAGRRILKPWYLDELPQLLNVLRGDISLVGPRPWPPELVERQVAEGQDYRLRIMAGLTGPAQVSKGGDQLFADLDERYVEACLTLGSWALVRNDLRILRQTLRVLARGEGLDY
jgi:lipopolysaccharide/colanic/teichoic acid biosynthesis glycosyltransferase